MVTTASGGRVGVGEPVGDWVEVRVAVCDRVGDGVPLGELVEVRVNVLVGEGV